MPSPADRYARSVVEVVVVGSANVDLVYRIPRIPAGGETILSTGTARARGGKGQNQAVAAARAGASTAFVAAVGDDGNGAWLREALATDGVDVTRVRTVEGPTGTAIILLEERGENAIVVDAAANASLVTLTEDDRAAIRDARVLVAQLEVPLEVVEESVTTARSAGTRVVLNAAPWRPLPASVLDAVDVLVVNEHEAAAFGDALAGVPVVVRTLGPRGAEVRDASGTIVVPGRVVPVVDTTGAGDTFVGALSARLAEGAALAEAAAFANAASSLAVETEGAVPSIPAREAIERRLRET